MKLPVLAALLLGGSLAFGGVAQAKHHAPASHGKKPAPCKSIAHIAYLGISGMT